VGAFLLLFTLLMLLRLRPKRGRTVGVPLAIYSCNFLDQNDLSLATSHAVLEQHHVFNYNVFNYRT